ncbi:hypothetical protein [Streptomyces nodosus]|uniref:hypothetical protein n=1 Tax=Streptomyces nodosus TaxID=40318 RepID=UPI0036E47B0E
MTSIADVLIPALEDAGDAHAAVIDRFRTDATFTPEGADRQRLESQVAEAQYHLGRIEARVREIRPPRGLLSAAGQMTWMVTRRAARASVLPLGAGVSAATEAVRGEGRADERRLLKNAENEYAAAARALATCQAGRDIAERLNDRETAELFYMLGRQDELLMETSEETLARRARAVVAATEGPRPLREEAAEGGSLLQAITRKVRAAMTPLQAVLQRATRCVSGTAGDAWREMPTATRVVKKVQGAMTREEDLPVPDFSQLDVTEIEQRLRSLSQTELMVIDGYERAHAGRPGVLSAAKRLRETEPWAGYDVMDPERIKTHLHDVPDSQVRQVLEYERRHRQRGTVIKAAEGVLQATS